MSDSAPKSYSADPNLYLYTSLTSGSSHIVTATSRLETILKANKIPFKAIDIATDEKARMIWGRRAGKDESGRVRKIPGLVQMGLVIGDLVEVEDWNEYGELKQHVNIVNDAASLAKPAVPLSSSSTPSTVSNTKGNMKPAPAFSGSATKTADEPKPPAGAAPTAFTLAMKQAGQEAAQKAKESKKKAPEPETFAGVGEAEPVKEEAANSGMVPASGGITEQLDGLSIDDKSTLQSPTSTSWRSTPQRIAKSEAGGKSETASHSAYKLESLQSPTSTAWRPTDSDPPILTHRGSSVSQASAEEIKRIEDQETIPEEDEEDEEDD